MIVQGDLKPVEDIVLVDDIITRGHTMIGATWRLLEVFPTANIRGFVAMRTISNPSSFSQIYDPAIGSVTYRQETEDCMREP
ncbi:MAG: hypothetical protein ACYC7D_01575 [Nitrososphaerales archaeon]